MSNIINIIREEVENYLNDNFWKWFRNSKVVDASGKPLKVYHGTNADFEKFGNAPLYYFSQTPKYASKFATDISLRKTQNINQPSVLPVYLSLQNPADLTEFGLDKISAEEFENFLKNKLNIILSTSPYSGNYPIWSWIKLMSYKLPTQLLMNGYDGIIMYEDTGMKGRKFLSDKIYVAFKPTQIKSAIGNTGEFNPKDSDITNENKTLENTNKNTYKDGDKYFNNKSTGMPSLDDVLNQGGDEGYYYWYKGNDGQVVYMSPEEYLNRVKEGLDDVDFDSKHPLFSRKSQNTIMDAIKQGNKINMPMLHYPKTGRFGQEGRHRAVVAKALKIKEIPVFVMRDVSVEERKEKMTEIVKQAITKLNLTNDKNTNIKLVEDYVYDNYGYRAHEFLTRWMSGFLKDSNIINEEDYRGYHTAPGMDDSPMHDIINTYGNDMYTPNALKYYGSGYPYDSFSIALIQKARNKPNMQVKIYRAVPAVLTNQEKINDYEKQKVYILKTGRLPQGVDNWKNKSEYYDYISDEIEKLKSLPVEQETKTKINSGDWVTINPIYAKQHGLSHLNNKYKILTKTVLAKNLFTDGNDVNEWGYVDSISEITNENLQAGRIEKGNVK